MVAAAADSPAGVGLRHGQRALHLRHADAAHRSSRRGCRDFLGTEATILYSSCFDANGGVFETLFGAEDAVISDELNHASLIDGIRLCKARRLRYRNADMADLRGAARGAPRTRAARVIVTDGVFSMDGSYAPLDEICDLADRYDALVMVDDSHAVGFVGAGGRGTPELFGVMDRVDILTGTLGKALGGASGGYVSAHQEIVDLLRQRSRPYLFSNAVAPTVAAGSLAALELAAGSDDARARLRDNATLFRSLMTEAGFDLRAGIAPDHPGDVPRRGRRPAGPRPSPTPCSPTASTSSRSPTRSSRGQGADPRPALGGAHRGGRAAVRRRVRRRPGRGGLTGPGGIAAPASAGPAGSPPARPGRRRASDRSHPQA